MYTSFETHIIFFITHMSFSSCINKLSFKKQSQKSHWAAFNSVKVIKPIDKHKQRIGIQINRSVKIFSHFLQSILISFRTVKIIFAFFFWLLYSWIKSVRRSKLHVATQTLFFGFILISWLSLMLFGFIVAMSCCFSS